MPTHFQVPTSATALGEENVWFDFCLHIKKTRGQFGLEEVQEWTCGIGLNEKGGMHNKEFDCYIENRIMLLFPDVEDKPSKRVLLKSIGLTISTIGLIVYGDWSCVQGPCCKSRFNQEEFGELGSCWNCPLHDAVFEGSEGTK